MMIPLKETSRLREMDREVRNRDRDKAKGRGRGKRLLMMVGGHRDLISVRKSLTSLLKWDW
jgi:hypothetical protein